MALKFKYCECGCKGYEASAGSAHFWIFWDLEESFYLHRGHGCISPRIGVFPSYEAAVEAATQEAKAELEKVSAALGV